MTTSSHRAVIVGASSLLGKELADELNRASSTEWELTLLDTEDAAGQVTAAGDEPLVIQPLVPGSFAGAEIVFFASDLVTTRTHWHEALAAGAGVVDLTGALAQEKSAVLRAPLLNGSGSTEVHLDLTTEAVVACHAASLMLCFLCARLQSRWGERARVAATLLLPASEQGKDGVDELHAQTVALLSFQPLPKDVYDAQVAFNLNAEFGPGARTHLAETAQRIAGEVQSLLGPEAAERCVFQCVQAPVFHGFSASVLLDFDDAVELDGVRQTLQHPALLNIAEEADASPSSAVLDEEGAVQASLRGDGQTNGRSAWLWLVGDSLRLAARNAVACASELLAMRPAGRVQ